MPGSARTQSFMLSTATVMIGPMADLYNLNKDAHSLGLAKNVVVSSEPSFIELTQGIRNQVVMSVKNNDGLKCSFDVSEFSLRNLAYAAGLDASGATYDPITVQHVTAGAAAPAATTVLVATDVTAQYPVGEWIWLQDGFDDKVHIAKISARSYAAPNTTITFAGYAIPAGVTFPTGSRIGLVKPISLGGAVPQPDLSAKIIGVMPKDQRPVVVMFPKIKITRGFNLNFLSDNFAAMPWEFTPYALVSTDTFYSDFGDNMFRIYPAQ
jgi:hypothetical protein